MTTQEEAERLEAEIFDYLPQCDTAQLEGVFVVLEKAVPENAKGKKTQMLKTIYRYLSELGEMTDNLVILQEIHKTLIRVPASEEVKTNEDLDGPKIKLETDDYLSLIHI